MGAVISLPPAFLSVGVGRIPVYTATCCYSCRDKLRLDCETEQYTVQNSKLHLSLIVDNNVVVALVEGFTPVSKEVYYSCRLVNIVSVQEDKVNEFDEGMGAGSSWESILIWINVFVHIIEQAFH